MPKVIDFGLAKAMHQALTERTLHTAQGELDWIVMESLEKDRSRRYETANGFATDIQRYLAGEPVLAAPPSARYRLGKLARKHRAALSTAAAITLLLVAGAAVSTWQAVRATRAEAASRLAEQDALASQRAESERAEGERLAKLDAEAKQAEAERQKTRAEAGEKLASERLVQVDAEKEKAVAEKQIAQAVLDFLQSKLLSQADVRNQADTLLRTGGLAAVTEAKENPTIRELLDRAASELTPDKIDANFPKQPLVQAAILQTVGTTYSGVGEYERAIGFLERSAALRRQHLGSDDSNTLTAMNALAQAYYHARKFDLALPIFEETLKLQKAKFSADHQSTVVYMINLASAYQTAGKRELALPLLQETLKLAKEKLGPHHPSTFAARNSLAVAYLAAGKLDLALSLFEETLKVRKVTLGPEHPDTVLTMSSLADTYRAAKMPDLAAALHEETLRLRKAKLGADHADTLDSLNRLAGAYWAARKMDLAVPLYENLLKRRKAKLGPDHPDTLDNHPDTIALMNRLAWGYCEEGDFDLAVPLFEQLWETGKQNLPEGDKTRIDTQHQLGVALVFAGRCAEAEPHLLASYRDGLSAKDFPKEWPQAYALRLVGLYAEWGKPAEEAEWMAKWQADLNHLGGRADWQYHHGSRMLRAAWFRAAERLLRDCLAIREKTQSDLWWTFNAKSMLGGALLGQKKYADAEPLLLAGYEGLKQREKTITLIDKVCLTEAAARLVQLYEALDKKDEAARWSKELEAAKAAQKKTE